MPEHLERSVLLVPASNWGMIQKAAAAPSDAVCIDLEDAVAPAEKEAARGNVVRAFKELDFGRKLKLFRMNGLDTSFAYRDLIEVVEEAGDRVDLVVVPKVSAASDVHFVATLLSQIETAMGITRPVGIEALIETALGCVNIREIASSSPRLETLIYGAGDYAASVRMPMASIGEPDEHDALYPGHRWHHVMHTIVSAARAFEKRAIDSPFAGIRDPEGFRKACAIGRAMGFDGKWCIHPTQIATVNETFVPPEAELRWALRVLEAWAAASAEGHGAISLDGRMVDVASIRMSQTIVERAKLAGLLPAG